MQNKLKRVKKTLRSFCEVLVMVSLVVSQTFLSEIFLYQNGAGNGLANVAKADINDPWYNNSYLHRKAINVDYTKVPNTDQSNFPVLVSLTDNDLRTSANNGDVQNANGYDIIFASQDGNTQLAHEIESYDATTGAINMWVKIPTLSHTANTVFYMYYDNGNITTSQENKTSVWDSNTKGVWHLKETGTNPTIYDSTSNSNNTTSQTWTPASGEISGAGSFNGSSQFAVVADSTSIRPSDSITYSMWIRPAANNTYVFDKGISYGGYGLRLTNDSKFNVEIAGWSNWIPNQTFSTSSWQHIAVTFSSSSVYFYYNGTQYGPYTRSVSMTSSGAPLVIGGEYTWQSGDGYQARPGFNGSIDEFHVSDIARSSDWIQTEYNNQSSPSTFYSVGSEENQITPTVATPTFSISAGNYPDTQYVTITTSTSGATIYYTTDDSTPTTSSTQYTGEITVSTSQTVKAIAVRSGYNDSAVGSATYLISPWYNNSYLHRKAINVDYTKVPNTDQSNFPVLVSLTDNDLRTSANNGDVQNANGYDIIFASQDGNTQLAHEIESYDATTGAINMWVKIPTLSHTANTVFYMYYDNGNITTSQENKTGVWDSNTKGVWHLKETGTNPTMNDSTSNSHNSTAQTWTPATGKIGGAASFNGTSQFGSVADSSDLRPADSITYSMWINPSEDNNYVFDKGISYGGYGLQLTDTDKFNVEIAGWSNWVPNQTFSTSSWQHIAVTFAGTNVYFYYNGTQYGPYTRSASMTSTGTPLVIGGKYTWESGDGYQARPDFNGSIDEFHVSDIARSSDWIQTEYNNQSSPSTFYSVGSEENILTVETPTFSLAEGTYSSAQPLTISTTTTGATIYYTTNDTAPTTSSTQYTGEITVSASQTIRAIAVLDGYNPSDEASATYVIDTAEPIAYVTQTDTSYVASTGTSVQTNSISVTEGNLIAVFLAVYNNSGSMDITDSLGNDYTAVEDAYTITPTPGVTGQWFYTISQFTGSDTITGSFSGSFYTIRAVEYSGIDATSPVDTSAVVHASGSTAPTFSTSVDNELVLSAYHIENGGSCTAGTGYTLLGTDRCSEAVARPAEAQIFSDIQSNISAPITASYGSSHIYGSWVVGFKGADNMSTVETPTFSLAAGSYLSSQPLTISTTTTGATIYYTTNDTAPTTSSTQYTGEITVSASQTIRAIAVLDGYNPSDEASATYTINDYAPITYVTQTDNAVTYPSGTSVQTSSISVTEGNLIAVFLAAYGSPATITGITDSLGNTYTAVENAYTLTNPTIIGQWFYTISQYTGSDTITGSFSGAYYTIRAVEYSGIDATSPVDTSAVVHASGSTAPTFSTSVANELVLAEYHIENGGSCSAGTGYTLLGTDRCSEAVARPAEAQIFSDIQSNISAPITVSYGSSHIYGSWVVGFKGEYNPTPTVATPSLSIATGTYNNNQTVEITTTTPNATIYYTTNDTAPTTSSTQYTGEITVSASQTIRAIAVRDGYDPSDEVSATYTLTVADPTFSPVAGTYTAIQNVNLYSATTGATIHYTTNGDDPDENSTEYTGQSITVSASQTIKAIAVKDGYTDSGVEEAVYTINLPTVSAPTFSSPGGTYASAQTVSIYTATVGDAIHYTTDGSTPTSSSTLYTGTPITVSVSGTLRAIGVKDGYVTSTPGSASYIIGTSNAAASPTFSITAGTYSTSQNVQLSTTTTDSTICYTTDGSNPTTDGAGTCTGSTQTYSTAISVAASLSIKAVTTKSGMDDSPLSKRAYVIGDNVITFHTSGRYFGPRITVVGNPTILWTFDDGGSQESTSSSATPTLVDFGTTGNRITTLTVTPASALVGININYSHEDRGPSHTADEYSIDYNRLPDSATYGESVNNGLTSVDGLANVAPWLQFWTSNYNPITSLDFSNFESIQDIECFMCQQLTSIDLENTPALTRLAVEAAGLTSLDLSTSPNLKDLRGALLNDSTFAINWGDTGEDVWHICTHDDAMTTTGNGQFPSFSQYPVLEQLWINNDNQYGTLHPSSTSLTTVWAQGDHFSSADFSGLFGSGQNAYVDIYNNQLTSLDISDDPGLTYLDAHGNQLSASAVDTILQIMDSYNVTADSTPNNGFNGTSGNYYINLTGNGIPSSTGLSYAANLTSRGWTVLTAS